MFAGFALFTVVIARGKSSNVYRRIFSADIWQIYTIHRISGEEKKPTSIGSVATL